MLEKNKTNLVNLFKQNTTINSDVGARIEYNMNSVLSNIVVRTSSTDSQYLSQIKTENGQSASLVVNPFKKLFPVDSIIKPFRPREGGIRYYISDKLNSLEYPATNNYSSLRTFQYPSDQSRVYYAGETNEYKYFVTPMGGNLDVTIKYVQSSVDITEAYGDGKKIYFKTNLSHGFTSGLNVTITNMGSFNMSGTISSIPEVNVFTIDDLTPRTKYVANGTATLSSPTKHAVTNKIVVTFEKFHYIPQQCSIILTKSDNTYITLGPYNVPANGKLFLHYVKKTINEWQLKSTEDPYGINDGVEFEYAEPISIKDIRITAANTTDRIIGLVEMSPRWVKDISKDIIVMEVKKEATANSEDILPVGKVSANTLTMQIVRYQDNLGSQSSIQVVNYDRNSNSIDTGLIYMIKGAEIKPIFKINHSAATTMTGVYDIVKQGTYYLDSWEIGPRGATSFTAFDGAKILMDKFAPERLYEGYSFTGIITALLDSVGFTNYKFNIKTSTNNLVNSNIEEDDSIPTVNWWWSGDSGRKSVWECIQELCNDCQMNAFFDEDNVLQFSSRNYIYDNLKEKSFRFTYDQDGTLLPNIISFSNKEIPAANQVNVIYKIPYFSNLVGSSGNLVTIPESYIFAGSLLKGMTETSPSEGEEIELEITQPTEYNTVQSPFSFKGFMLINSEIIEYDAIQYKLVNKTKSYPQKVQYIWIESESDVAKYLIFAESPNFNSNNPDEKITFGPSNKIRVKKRGALGTKATSHDSVSKAFEGGKWKAYKATWQ